MRRLFWVAVGAAAGIYAVRTVQKTLDAYSPSGLAERATGAGGAVRAFADDVRAGMADSEAELRAGTGLDAPLPAGDQIRLPGRHGAHAADS